MGGEGTKKTDPAKELECFGTLKGAGVRKKKGGGEDNGQTGVPLEHSEMCGGYSRGDKPEETNPLREVRRRLDAVVGKKKKSAMLCLLRSEGEVFCCARCQAGKRKGSGVP